MFPICCFIDHSRFSLQSFCLLAACSSCKREMPATHPSPPLISAIVLYTVTVEPTCCIWLGAGNLTIGLCAGGSLRPIRSSRYARVHGPLRTTGTRIAPPPAVKYVVNQSKRFRRAVQTCLVSGYSNRS